jgi:hypothetical protein
MRLIPNPLCLLLISVLLFLGCSKSESSPTVLNNQNGANQNPVAQTASSSVPAASATNSRGKIDPCGLLTADEVKAIQGEAFKETKASAGSETGWLFHNAFLVCRHLLTRLVWR